MLRKTPKRPLLLLLILLASPLVIANATAAPHVYKWVDEKTGEVHYGQQPPSNIKEPTKIQVKTQTTTTTTTNLPMKPGTVSTTTSSTDAKVNPSEPGTEITEKEKKEHEELLQKNCETATNNLKTLEKNKLVVVEDEQGKARALTPEEHRAHLEKAKKDAEIYCATPNSGASEEPAKPVAKPAP